MAAKIGIPWLRISIHALREEGDVDSVIIIYRSVIFLSTPSARRATPRPSKTQGLRFISIHALREEGDLFLLQLRLRLPISIHALREEGDSSGPLKDAIPLISIHALREEGDDPCQRTADGTDGDFYPRPPRGGRQCPAIIQWAITDISIHALREEGDAFFMPWVRTLPEFLSTPSARRATEQACENHRTRPISIHALREEGDPARIPLMSTAMHFYPRPPRGGRQKRRRERACKKTFLSTPSARRATLKLWSDEAAELFLSTPSARRATE